MADHLELVAKPEMMGRSHLTVGACFLASGAALHLLPWDGPRVAALNVGLVLYGNLAPDHDHRNSSITKAWGPISWAYSGIWRLISWFVYQATKTRKDHPSPGVHRTFTHTVPGALLLSATTVALLVQSQIAACVLCAFLGGATAASWRRSYLLYGAVAAGLLAYDGFGLLATSWPALSLALFAGCLMHVGSDCTTRHGCPIKFPRLSSDGRRWRNYGTPEWMRYSTDSEVERWAIRSLVGVTIAIVYWGLTALA